MKPYISNKNSLERKFSTLKLALVLGLGLILLISPKLVFSACPFETDFEIPESYGLGDLGGQGDWEFWDWGHWQVNDDNAFSGFQSIFCASACGNKRTGSEVASGKWVFNTWITEGSNINFWIADGSDLADVVVITGEGFIGYWDDGIATTTQQVIFEEWQPLEIQWDYSTQKTRVRYALEVWSGWHDPYDNWTAIDTLLIGASAPTGDRFIDFISSELPPGSCGPGNDCIFCLTQSSCEGNNCYWIDLPFPFASNCIASSSPIETATGTQFDFDIYYTANSQFSTPTAFITGLAEATQPFLVILSSWLDNFSDLFDLLEAQQKGEEIGGAIPQARGYLIFFNSLFADLPLSEILLVYLVILIGLIIFRIVRQIKKLFAF